MKIVNESDRPRAWLLSANGELQELLDPSDVAQEMLPVIASSSARGAPIDPEKSGQYERFSVPGGDNIFLFVWSRRRTPVPSSVYAEVIRLAETPQDE